MTKYSKEKGISINEITKEKHLTTELIMMCNPCNKKSYFIHSENQRDWNNRANSFKNRKTYILKSFILIQRESNQNYLNLNHDIYQNLNFVLKFFKYSTYIAIYVM